MVHACWWYFFSKFTEFFDTVSIFLIFALVKILVKLMFIIDIFRASKENFSNFSTSHRSSWGYANVRYSQTIISLMRVSHTAIDYNLSVVWREILSRRSLNILWMGQLICSYSHVHLLFTFCNGTTVSKISLVEKVSNCIANGPIHFDHGSCFPTSIY